MIAYRDNRQPLVPPGGAELYARDMTAVFAADLPLGAAQAKLAEIDQWVPIDGDPDASLGVLVDCNSTGPLRLGYGAWRDLLLGVQFRNGRDELITVGGQTVKNVAGYDVTKFMVGQHGAFGRLATLTTRTYRRPAGAILATHAPDPSIVLGLMPTPLRPQWSLLTPDALLCGYLGDESTLAWYEANVTHRSAPTPRSVERRSFSDDVAHRGRVWRGGRTNTFRAAVPPARLAEFAIGMRGSEWAADAAFGIVVGVSLDAERESVRRRAVEFGGSASFVGRDDFDVSTSPAERRIIEQLKHAFDPDRRLAPLPWQST